MRTEYGDMMKFTRMVAMELDRCPDVNCQVFTGNLKKNFSENDIVLSFHRGSNYKNCEKHGASVFVREDASADIQYEAFRLLSSICEDDYFRMLGVHTVSERSAFQSINSTGCDRTFVFCIGYIDSAKDNRIFDAYYEILAEKLAKRIKEVFKEEKNDDNT